MRPAASPLLNRRSAVQSPPGWVATNTAPTIPMQTSREYQNSSAVGSALPGCAVGSTRTTPVQPVDHSRSVMIASTTATANATVITLNSNRAWVRAVAVAPPRTWRGSTASPTSGTRNPKKSTQLTVCGSRAVPMPTSSRVPVPATTRTVRAAPAGRVARSGGNTISATT